MLRQQRRSLRALPVNSLVPNILTVLALCAGMSGIRFALEGRWELSVFAIVVSAVLDGLDGRMARLLKGTSKFGAELDSLSDFICFGVAPAFIIYEWSVNQIGGIGWVAALAYATCCALRLARFNTALEDPDRPHWASQFFSGTAAPASAGFALLPMMLSFQLGDDIVREPALDAAWLLAVALLMVSRIATYSFKRLRVRREYVLPTLVLVGVSAAVLVSYPWFTLSAMSIAYLFSIPFSIAGHRRLMRAHVRDIATAAMAVGRETASREDQPVE